MPKLGDYMLGSPGKTQRDEQAGIIECLIYIKFGPVDTSLINTGSQTKEKSWTPR